MRLLNQFPNFRFPRSRTKAVNHVPDRLPRPACVRVSLSLLLLLWPRSSELRAATTRPSCKLLGSPSRAINHRMSGRLAPRARLRPRRSRGEFPRFARTCFQCAVRGLRARREVVSQWRAIIRPVNGCGLIDGLSLKVVAARGCSARSSAIQGYLAM